jgi:O-methyltransferase
MHPLKVAAMRHLPPPVLRLIRSTRSLWSRERSYRRHEYAGRYEFLRKAFTALEFNGIAGDYAEFGCCGAMTFSMAYRILATYLRDGASCHLWAFDSFQGLPEPSAAEDAHPEWVRGAMCTGLDEFHLLCRSRGIPRAAYTTVAGFYEQSLVEGAPGPRPAKIRLAYIDCDLYTSTRAVLRFLLPRLQPGMILAFDDYYCCSSRLPSGERLAVAEAFSDHPQWRLLPYIQFGWHGMSFFVEEAGIGARGGNHGAHW